MSWMDVGIHGTTQVVNFKTILKGSRQKNTLGMKNLARQIGIFKELVNGDEEQKPSKLLNDKLESVLKAQKIVESTLDLVSLNIAELTSLMCEMQNARELSEAQIEELKKEITKQENEFNKRGDEVEALIRDSNKLLIQWEYTPPDPTPIPPAIRDGPKKNHPKKPAQKNPKKPA